MATTDARVEGLLKILAPNKEISPSIHRGFALLTFVRLTQHNFDVIMCSTGVKLLTANFVRQNVLDSCLAFRKANLKNFKTSSHRHGPCLQNDVAIFCVRSPGEASNMHSLESKAVVRANRFPFKRGQPNCGSFWRM
jgi:hypothetical protein